MKRKLPADGTGIDWVLHSVPGEEGKYLVETVQDEAPILEHNLALSNSDYTGDLTFGRHVASIPSILWNRWVKEYPVLREGKGPEFEKTLHRLIMENNKVKVNGEKLGKVRTA